MKLGIIGKSLKHSFSPAYFNELFLKEQLENYSYKVFELESLNKEILHNLVKSEQLRGFNVTIPYKEQIIHLLDELSDDASKIGAVNTVEVIRKSDATYILKGHNTDWSGFLKSIRPFLAIQHQKALILGTGGASKAIAYALSNLGIDFFFVSRTKSDHHNKMLCYDELNEAIMNFFKLIINTTPLGTFPAIDTYPDIPYSLLNHEHLICDLVYNPEITSFMKRAQTNHAVTMNGLSMLKFQANEAWEIWKNKKGHSD